ncbi:MAG: NAD(P)H-binding protein [Alphaproteobacteria bacterium]|nr:NAD(P)H-binding protein [Alphaproteobacteria bacterium]
MATFFVAGATGYTGRALVARAAADGHVVVAHVRPDSRSGEAAVAALRAAGAARVDRSPWGADALPKALADAAPDAVFALLGTTRARGRDAARQGLPAETYASVDRDLTLELLAACATCSPAPRFVYLSSLGADRPRGNAYLRARHQVEQALRDAAVPWTIARPSIITGPDRPEDRPAEHLGAVVADAGLSLLGALGARRARDRFASITADTLAAGLIRAALDPAAAGAVLDSADLR